MRLDSVLTYGLSSEYLKSTKEAKAKSKTQDADRSAYRCNLHVLRLQQTSVLTSTLRSTSHAW